MKIIDKYQNDPTIENARQSKNDVTFERFETLKMANIFKGGLCLANAWQG